MAISHVWGHEVLTFQVFHSAIYLVMAGYFKYALLTVKGMGYGSPDISSIAVSGKVRRFDYVLEEYYIPQFLRSKLHPVDGGSFGCKSCNFFLSLEEITGVFRINSPG